MGEYERTGAQPRSTPGSGEIIGYGLLATAVAVGVLYLDGQRPRDIAVIAGAILALLTTLVLIAPRLRVPDQRAPDQRAPDQDDAGPRIRRDEPAREYGRPAPAPPSSPVATTADSDSTTARPGRRAKRGRRRR